MARGLTDALIPPLGADDDEPKHPCDRCEEPTAESELRWFEEGDDDEEGWLCAQCWTEVTAGEEWKLTDDEADSA